MNDPVMLAIIDLLVSRSYWVDGKWQIQCSPSELFIAAGLNLGEVEKLIGAESVRHLGLRGETHPTTAHAGTLKRTTT